MRLKTVAIVLATVALIGCATASRTAGTPSGTTAEVEIKGFQFVPAQLEIAVGTTVIWTNRDDILHTATSGTTTSTGIGTYDASSDGRFDGRMDGAGTTFSFRFDHAGTYQYFCDRHRHMIATVVVK